MKTALRTTAGLFYWFAYKTGQVPWDPYDPTPGNITLSSTMPYSPETNTYHLYKGANGILTAYSSNAETYSWEYKLCNEGQWWYAPLPQYGLIMPDWGQNWGQNFNIFNQSFNNQSCPSDMPLTIFLQMKVTSYNGNGTKKRQDFKIQPYNYYNVYGGCPWFYVEKDSIVIPENNIFHRSEFPEYVSIDIKDVYKLNNVPRFVNNVTTIQINEVEKDVTNLDNVRFIAVDHPEGSEVGITENNDIVLYYSSTVTSTDNAVLNNYSNITPYIQYNAPGKKVVKGLSVDSIYAHYDSVGQMNKKKMHKSLTNKLHRGIYTDSLALIGEIGHNEDLIYPVGHQKNYAGIAEIHSMTGVNTRNFARRELLSNIIIPFSGIDDVVEYVDISWLNDYEVTYFSVVPVSYYGFDITELTLLEATHNLTGDIIQQISSLDLSYVTIDSLSLITLKYYEPNQPAAGYVRDYLIEFNGHYITPNDDGDLDKPISVQNIKPIKFELFNNYPNPFNPKTIIKYSIPANNHVSLKVYDITGQLIKELVNEYKISGIYNIEFDGTNYASGVYFYTLEAGGFIQSKKMVIIK